MTTTKRWVVIGISGATCSGKSTLSNKVYEDFPGSILVRQDDYFLPADDPCHIEVKELNHMNWEVITSLDMQRMLSDVLKILQLNSCEKSSVYSKKTLLILDGFLLFKHKAITDLCDRRYFLTLTKEQCWERRKTRTYDPPDVPGYFDKVVWPEYVKHKNEITQDSQLRENITFIDGSNDIEEIYKIVSKEINQLLS